MRLLAVAFLTAVASLWLLYGVWVQLTEGG